MRWRLVELEYCPELSGLVESTSTWSLQMDDEASFLAMAYSTVELSKAQDE